MRVLICGDIHGNLVSLEKLLKVEKNNYDLFISHGDVVNYGPWGNECVELVDSLNMKILLKGNHEHIFLDGSYSGSNIIANSFFTICFPLFSEFQIIKKWSDDYKLDDFIITHTIDGKYIFPDSDLEQLLLKFNQSFIIGHSHKQFQYLGKFNKMIVNTGSLGQNRTYINVSDYIIFDTYKYKVELKNFVFDLDLVINEMKSKKYTENCIKYYLKKGKHVP